MKLTDEDKTYLKGLGYHKKDLKQIAVATSLTAYTYKGHLICDADACEVLGKEDYLSGIARSAFHWSASRETPEGETVLFDSRALFTTFADLKI